MMRSHGARPGFAETSAPVACSRLTNAVAASLAIALSVCLTVTLTMLAISPLTSLPV